MSVLNQLASALGRRDELPNVELAQKIAAAADRTAVKELIENLSNKDKNIQNDCIKTLYEAGALNPALIAGYIKNFELLLESSNNRMQWSAMCALNNITLKDPGAVFALLGKLAAIADIGSVITRDNYVSILIRLCTLKKYKAAAFDLLNDQLKSCPCNQLPMYAENAVPVINTQNKTAFAQTLLSRLGDIDKTAKRNRIEKVLQKISRI